MHTYCHSRGWLLQNKPFTYYLGQHVFPGRFHVVCMYVYIASFFSGVHITWCFPFEDFHVVWEYPYLEKLPVLRRCSFEKMLVLHWYPTLKTVITSGGASKLNFLKPGMTFPWGCKEYMQAIFLWESGHCRGVLTQSALLCSLQCHCTFHLRGWNLPGRRACLQ